MMNHKHTQYQNLKTHVKRKQNMWRSDKTHAKHMHIEQQMIETHVEQHSMSKEGEGEEEKAEQFSLFASPALMWVDGRCTP